MKTSLEIQSHDETALQQYFRGMMKPVLSDGHEKQKNLCMTSLQLKQATKPGT